MGMFVCHGLLLVALWLHYVFHPTTKTVQLAIARLNYLLTLQSDQEAGEESAGLFRETLGW